MKVVVIGNGVAGVTAARVIRERDPDAEIAVYSREPYHYYFRPRLPEVVAGELEIADIIANPPDWYKARRIDVHLSRPVSAVDTADMTVTLANGSREEFDKLLVATGSDAFVPPVDGVKRDGVFSLRTADDAVAIRDWARRSARAVVVGCGLLGLESARGLRKLGLDVTVLENGPRILGRQLDENAATLLERLIGSLGIRILTRAKTAALPGNGAVSGVALEDGAVLPADIVLFATGVRCASGFLSGSGINVHNGVVVDCDMRTNVRDVFAAGDVAEYDGRSWGIVPVALAHADAAGRSITGDTSRKRCDVVPSTTLKVTGIDVFSAGVQSCTDAQCREFVEHDPDAGRYRKIVTRDDRIIGAILVGSRKGVREIGLMIQQGTPVDRYAGAVVREDFDFRAALSAS